MSSRTDLAAVRDGVDTRDTVVDSNAVSAPIAPPTSGPYARRMSAPAWVIAAAASVEHVGCCQHVLSRGREQRDRPQAVAHAGLLEVGRNTPSIRPTVGKFCMPEKPSDFKSSKKLSK